MWTSKDCVLPIQKILILWPAKTTPTSFPATGSFSISVTTYPSVKIRSKPLFFHVINLVSQVSARLISCRRECQEEPTNPNQPPEPSPNLLDDSCQRSASGEGSADGFSGESGCEEGSSNIDEVKEFKCSNGRTIIDGVICDGQKDCPAQGEDEMFEECYEIFKEYKEEPHKLCATIWAGNERVPQFPCFKTGHCIDSKLVR